MQERTERVSAELADRIRQSEERTAKLLNDARERIDQRLAETQRKTIEAATPAAPTYVEPGVAPFGHTSYSTEPLPGSSSFNRRFVDEDPVEADVAQDFEDDDLLEPAPLAEASHQPRVVAPASPQDEPDLLTPRDYAEEPSPFDEPSPFAKLAAYSAHRDQPASGAFDDFDDGAGPNEDEDDGFLKTDETPVAAPLATAYAAPAYSTPSFAEEVEDDYEPEVQPPLAEAAPVATRPSSTRELIEQARASARASSQDPGAAKKARNAETGGSLFSGFGLSRPKKSKNAGASMKTMLLLSGVVAAAGVGALGLVLMNDKPTGAAPARVAEGQTASGQLATSEVARPLAAVALNPTPLAGANETPATPVNPAAAVNGPALYEDGARRIEAHDFTGVDTLRKAANLGYAPAQFYLAKLYEDGQAGLRKDLNEARVWTERAAAAGDRKAMHNLALYYFEGTGGPKNMTTAADWFRKAADLGLVDSQYNLARLYEKGFGVSQNPAEAYKWYLIAAHAGDTESRASAQRLKGQLSAEAEAAAERAAGAFQAQQQSRPAPTQLAQATAPNDVAGAAIAQRALSRLGYYQGPTDGSPSPALKGAIAAYQRDQGLPATGVPDAALSQRLAVIAQ
jgi:localization factor PodJL